MFSEDFMFEGATREDRERLESFRYERELPKEELAQLYAYVIAQGEQDVPRGRALFERLVGHVSMNDWGAAFAEVLGDDDLGGRAWLLPALAVMCASIPPCEERLVGPTLERIAAARIPASEPLLVGILCDVGWSLKAWRQRRDQRQRLRAQFGDVEGVELAEEPSERMLAADELRVACAEHLGQCGTPLALRAIWALERGEEGALERALHEAEAALERRHPGARQLIRGVSLYNLGQGSARCSSAPGWTGRRPSSTRTSLWRWRSGT